MYMEEKVVMQHIGTLFQKHRFLFEELVKRDFETVPNSV